MLNFLLLITIVTFILLLIMLVLSMNFTDESVILDHEHDKFRMIAEFKAYQTTSYKKGYEWFQKVVVMNTCLFVLFFMAGVVTFYIQFK